MKYTIAFAISMILISCGIILAYDPLEKSEEPATIPQKSSPNNSTYSQFAPTGKVTDMRERHGIESQSHTEAFVASEDAPEKSESEEIDDFPSESYQEQVERLK